MKQQLLAIWIFGAIGSGKSTLLASLPPKFRVIDQDAELEREMMVHGLPFDTRLHDADQAGAFAELRRHVADKLWKQVPRWREDGIPLAFETTGNKPPLFRAAVEECRAAGYLNIGVALRCSLALCESRNRARRRVLPLPVVETSWLDVESYLSDGTYAELFGHDYLMIPEEGTVPDLMSAIHSIAAHDS
jgi:predicted kinase